MSRGKLCFFTSIIGYSAYMWILRSLNCQLREVSKIRWLSWSYRNSISYSGNTSICECMHICTIYTYVHRHVCVCALFKQHIINSNKHSSKKWRRNKQLPLIASQHDFPGPRYVAAQASDGCRSHGRDQEGRSEESRSTCGAPGGRLWIYINA